MPSTFAKSIRLARALALALLAAPLVGCFTLPTNSDQPLTQGHPVEGDGVTQASHSQDDEAVDTGVPGDVVDDLVDFSYVNDAFKKLTGKAPNKDLARKLYKEADVLYREAAALQGPERQSKFAEAGAKFAAAAERWPDSALQQDGLFMAGESYFFADYYKQANDCYEQVVKTYPNNRYLDTIDQRRFAIAKFWLELQKENPEPFYYVNWTDNTRPWRDTRGHALRVFDRIRIDDPTGKLADDATLAAGNEYFSQRKCLKADEFYTDLRKTYPASEHQFMAHFLGLKAKLSSYMGPNYSVASLDEAEKLIKQTRRQFPRDAEKEKEFLDRAMAEIRYKKAEKIWTDGQFFDRRAEYRAATLTYEKIVRDFDDTPFASKARERIAQMAGKPPVPPQQMQWLVNLFPEHDEVKPLLKATEEYRQQEAERGTAIAQPQNPTAPQMR
jgi:TolA-binding protein